MGLARGAGEIVYRPVGVVRNPHPEEVVRSSWRGVKAYIEVFPEYAEGLAGLEEFSHIIVVAHLDRAVGRGFRLRFRPRGFLKVGLREEELPEVGVFCTASPLRPNPVAVTIMRLLKVDGRLLHVDHCGRISLTLIDRDSRKAVRVILRKWFSSPTIDDPRFQELFQRVMVRKEQLPKSELEEFRSMMDRASLEVLSLPDEEYFIVEELEVEEFREEELRSPPARWVSCSHCGGLVSESKAVKREEKYYCAECAGEETYAVLGRKIARVNLSDVVRLVRRA
jgi:tRNA (Thr-GGU) A37 N-methylase